VSEGVCRPTIAIGSPVHVWQVSFVPIRGVPISAPTLRKSSIFLRRIVGSSLTTSAMSRHTFSVQAAGAGSHKPKSWRRRPRQRSPDSFRCPLSALKSVSLHHDGVLHQTSLRSRWTMMTRANSLHLREGGSPDQCCRHSRTRTRADTGHSRTDTAPTTAAPAHDGRILCSQSDRAT
jgi:hypothetical protein